MTRNSLEQDGYQRALALLHDCATSDGFVASPSRHDNYRRIWSRDGTIIALAASGTRHQGWSAAAAIIGHHALAGESVFRITGDG
jgi:hypothetical protein